jgi:periplasmic divalent cation tolerance protein
MSSGADRPLQVWVAVPRPAVARRVAARLLAERLCACAQILGPIESRYRWRGKLETAREWLLVVKTRRGCYKALERTVRELHPYDVPEILATEVVVGSAPYLAWLDRETRPERPGAPRRRAAGFQTARRRSAR